MADDSGDQTSIWSGIWNSCRENPTFWGAVLYVWLSTVGGLYSWFFYNAFGINIFDFAATSDFLLVAFSKADSLLAILLLAILLAIAAVFWLLLVLILIASVVILTLIALAGSVSVFIILILTIVVFSALTWSVGAYVVFSALVASAGVFILFIWAIFALNALVLSAKALIRVVYQSVKRLGPFFYQSLKGNWPSNPWDAFTQALASAWNLFTTALTSARDTFVQEYTSTLNAFIQEITDAWSLFTQTLTSVRGTFTQALASIWNLFTRVPTSAWNLFTQTLTGTWNISTKAFASLPYIVLGLYIICILLFSPYLGYREGVTMKLGVQESQQESQTETPVTQEDLIAGIASGQESQQESQTETPVTQEDPPAGIASGVEALYHFLTSYDYIGKIYSFVVAPIIRAPYTLIVPYIEETSKVVQRAILGGDNGSQGQHVRVTTRQDVDRPQIRLPDALLIGTTSNFHFFYEKLQNNDQNKSPLPITPVSHGKSLNDYQNIPRVFIVPTANIASLEFNPSSDPDPPPLSCYLEKFEPIRPFPEAEHTQLEGNGSGKLTDLVEKMEPRFENYTLQQLMLIGRVDSKPLRPEGIRFYGSQRGLAQARAEWVQQKLLEAFPDQIDPSRITLRGDDYLPPDKNDDKKRQFDRSVEVHACWAPKIG